MPLTDISIRNAQPSDRARKLFDGGGLYLEVTPKGSKYWRLKYRFHGREKRISLGVYPDTSLRKARERRDNARRLLSDGIDPSEQRKAQKRATSGADSFETVAREWFAKRQLTWAYTHADKIIRRLERDIFPWLGRRPVREIQAPELLSVLRRIESRGAIETAHRAKQNCGQVFRYAVATGRAERDPSADLKGALAPTRPTSFASIKEPEAVGALLRAIDGYSGSMLTKCALRLVPLVFVRPGELRKAEWSEFDFDAAEWRIPTKRMKANEPHIVPLSEQAVAILEELRPLTGQGCLVFPGMRSRTRPMSENTVNAALRRLGYSGQEMTAHGFRSMASTLLNEQGWNRDAIERQLAHAERNSVRAAYNYAEYLPQRREMMQAWADYLDRLKAGGKKVVAINSSAYA